ncbi:hypothetical protein GCM10010168_27360 [Actinoplanes ianthinogenes]|uniref:Uncharacterized protein n=1 Tax=Actinoplanes ianthinogenes TaxID=122358 RepID=A0ABM7LKT6_9ACTN|nr:hypothetical protein Aiant_05330 [Actinoplanes ianthinogenes]GGR08743.1 hypothetical protein GCM10010168_27360 [Actinoplanes ianthinogenes]
MHCRWSNRGVRGLDRIICGGGRERATLREVSQLLGVPAPQTPIAAPLLLATEFILDR